MTTTSAPGAPAPRDERRGWGVTVELNRTEASTTPRRVTVYLIYFSPPRHVRKPRSLWLHTDPSRARVKRA